MGDVIIYCGYCRISTDEQISGISLELQEAEIKKYANKHKLAYSGTYKEVISGTKDPFHRPQIKEILNAGFIKGIICMRYDRLGRSDETELFYALMKKKGMDFRFLDNGGIDTETAIGKVIFSVTQALAKYEVGQLRERTRNALKKLKDDGRLAGTKPFGYSIIEGKDGKKYLKPDKEQLRTLRTIHELSRETTKNKKGKEKTISLNEICRRLTSMGCKNNRGEVSWNPQSVKRYLSKECPPEFMLR